MICTHEQFEFAKNLFVECLEETYTAILNHTVIQFSYILKVQMMMNTFFCIEIV